MRVLQTVAVANLEQGQAGQGRTGQGRAGQSRLDISYNGKLAVLTVATQVARSLINRSTHTDLLGIILV